MDNKITKIKDRVLQIAKNKGISYELFSVQIGMSYGSFKGKAKDSPLNSDAIVNILTMYPDVNPDWLLTGKGPMLRADGAPTKPNTTESPALDAHLIQTNQRKRS